MKPYKAHCGLKSFGDQSMFGRIPEGGGGSRLDCPACGTNVWKLRRWKDEAIVAFIANGTGIYAGTVAVKCVAGCGTIFRVSVGSAFIADRLKADDGRFFEKICFINPHDLAPHAAQT